MLVCDGHLYYLYHNLLQVMFQSNNGGGCGALGGGGTVVTIIQ